MTLLNQTVIPRLDGRGLYSGAVYDPKQPCVEDRTVDFVEIATQCRRLNNSRVMTGCIVVRGAIRASANAKRMRGLFRPRDEVPPRSPRYTRLFFDVDGLNSTDKFGFAKPVDRGGTRLPRRSRGPCLTSTLPREAT